ncbi:hexokinase RNJ42_00558 [Nakaseomyces bracarensis]|uniref:hexokinase n=1 Tax=Nakaseomyces bracarensis TaxID=273131 RepID=UPI003871754E
MTICNPGEIIEEVKKQLAVHKSIGAITQEFQYELEYMLKNCKNSMLPFPSIDFRMWSECNTPMKLLAIDFGGSVIKFAVISMPLCQLEFKDDMEIQTRIVDLKFFDVIVEWICTRLTQHFHADDFLDLKVAITFSFPLNSNNEIVAMGKGYKMSPEIEGISILDILKQSFDRQSDRYQGNFTFEIKDVINDSLAVHMSSKFLEKDDNDKISLIVGTGVNSCFEVQFQDLPQFKQDIISQFTDKTPERVLINSELGFLGARSKAIEQSIFDTNIDTDMPLESVTSGKWIPQLLKNILAYYNLAPRNGIDKVDFSGKLVNDILDPTKEDSLLELWEIEELVLIKRITELIINRGAIYLVAALNAIRKFVNPEVYISKRSVDIDYVGSFLQKCSYYQERILLHSKNRMTLQFLENSNLYGCAIMTYDSIITDDPK